MLYLKVENEFTYLRNGPWKACFENNKTFPRISFARRMFNGFSINTLLHETRSFFTDPNYDVSRRTISILHFKQV